MKKSILISLFLVLFATAVSGLTLEEFIDDEDSDGTYINIEKQQAVNTITFLVNITNSSTALVNLTHGGVCIGLPDPYTMTYTGVEFEDNCTVNTTLLTEGNNTITALAYNFTGGTDQANYTIIADYTRPIIRFGEWWNTQDADGDPVSFTHYYNLLDDADIFYSPNETTLSIKLNATDNDGISAVFANFSSAFNTFMGITGGNCSDEENLTLSGNYWVLDCDLGSFNKSLIENSSQSGEDPVLGFDITFSAEDIAGNPSSYLFNSSAAGETACDVQGVPPSECLPVLTPILIHSIGVMGPEVSEYEEDDACFNFGSGTTDFDLETNFSAVDFTIDMEVNLTCIYDYWNHTGDLPAETGFKRMMIINFSNLDFNNQETAMKLSMLADNIDVEFKFPGEFGESYIYINSSYFAELNESATIRFFHLPFKGEPAIMGAPGAAGVTGASVWEEFTDPFWSNLTAGNLTFNVLGFSQYNITDNATPVIQIVYPTNGTGYTTAVTLLNFTVNGTGTDISSVTATVNGASYLYNSTINTSNCTDLDGETSICEIILNLTDGSHNVTIVAYDYGGTSGNSRTKTISFTQDSTSPYFTQTTPINTTKEYHSAFTYDVNATDAIAFDSFSINDTTDFAIEAATGVITNNTPLTIGVYSVNITINDTAGNENSTIISLAVSDTTAPTWSQTPSSQTNEYGTSFTYDVNATDAQAITYSINDTNNFSVVGGTGVITNNTVLSLGAYSLQINATDASSNTITTTTVITVSDTTAPYFSPLPTTQEINYTQAFGYQINGADNHAVDGYSVSDSTNFVINSTGYLLNNTLLAVGIYNLTITANDSSGNENTTNLIVKVSLAETSNVTANASTEIDLSNADSNITLFVGSNVTTVILATKQTPTASGTTSSLTALKGLNITVDNSTSGNLTWALIKIYYLQSELTSANINESSLKIYYYNETAGDWQLEPNQGVDTSNNYVWANVTHFSLFGTFGTAPQEAEEEEEETPRRSSGGGSSSSRTTSIVGTKASHGWGEVTSGATATMSVNKEQIPITELSFTTKNRVTSVSVTVSELTKAPDTSKVLTSKVYKYMQIDKSGMDNDDLESVEFDFKVEKSWLTENSIAENEVVLARLNGEWNELVTTKTDDDETYVYYTSIAPGLSYFAITTGTVIETQASSEDAEAAEAGVVEEVMTEETDPEVSIEEEPVQTPEEPTLEIPPEPKKAYGWLIVIGIIVIGVLIYIFVRSKKE